MSALWLLWQLLTGHARIVSDSEEFVVDADKERIEVNATYNRRTGEGRVISNVSTRVAATVHGDLLTVPAPQEVTTIYTMALGQAVHGKGASA